MFEKLIGAAPGQLFLIFGLICILIAIIGKFRQEFDLGKWGRIAAGVSGIASIALGLWLVNRPGDNFGSSGGGTNTPPPSTTGNTNPPPLEAKEIGQFVGHSRQVMSVAVSGDGLRMLSGSADRTMRLWNLKTLKEERQYPAESVLSVAISQNGKNGLSCSENNEAAAQMWNLDTGQLIHSFDLDKPLCVAFSPDDTQVMCCGRTDVRLWDLKGNLLRKFIGGKSWCTSGAFIPRGSKAVVTGRWSSYVLWDLKSGTEEVHDVPGQMVTRVAATFDGKHVLTASQYEKFVRLWDLHGKMVQQFELNVEGIYTIAFSRNGKYFLAGGKDQTIRVWDAETGVPKHTYSGHSGSVNSAVFTPDDKYIISGGDDSTIRLWGFPF